MKGNFDFSFDLVYCHIYWVSYLPDVHEQ